MKVFVYGTLKRGYRNHPLLESATYVGDGVLHDYGVFETGYDFPGILPHEGSYVVGELYEINERILQSLDRLEGFYDTGVSTNLYNREVVTIKQDLGALYDTEAYVYIWNRAKGYKHEFIDNGKWRF